VHTCQIDVIDINTLNSAPRLTT